jgi:hypothetical protein
MRQKVEAQEEYEDEMRLRLLRLGFLFMQVPSHGGFDQSDEWRITIMAHIHRKCLGKDIAEEQRAEHTLFS